MPLYRSQFSFDVVMLKKSYIDSVHNFVCLSSAFSPVLRYNSCQLFPGTMTTVQQEAHPSSIITTLVLLYSAMHFENDHVFIYQAPISIIFSFSREPGNEARKNGGIQPAHGNHMKDS